MKDFLSRQNRRGENSIDLTLSMPSTPGSGASQDLTLRRAVEDVVDRLSIFQTSMVDSAFSEWPLPDKGDAAIRPSSKSKPSEEDTSALGPPGVDALKAFAAATSNIFGEKAPSSHFLATEMMADYRGEIAACVSSTPSSSDLKAGEVGNARREYLFLNGLTDEQCIVFKKKLKKRIHEWERTISEETGSAGGGPNRKLQLRPLFELYCVSRDRIQHLGEDKKSVHGKSVFNSNRGVKGGSGVSSSTTSSERSSADGLRGNARLMNSTTGTGMSGSSAQTLSTGPSHLSGTSSTGTGATSSLASGGIDSGHARHHVVPIGSSLPSETGAGEKTDGGRSSEEEGGGSSSNPSTLSQKQLQIVDSIAARLPRIHLGTKPAEEMSLKELLEEKQLVKGILLRFEHDASSALGFPVYGQGPHRRCLSSVYYRYSELKGAVNRLSAEAKAAASGKGGDSKSEARGAA